ncbi:FAD-dependent monooxygenase [Nocardiopsis flavescens]
MYEESTPVLIIGGGLVGLSASLFLSWRGVPSVLVERHPGTSVHPRAWGLYPRTLELLRAAGVEKEVMAESAGFAGHVLNGRVESLAGAEIAVGRIPEPDDVGAISPVERIVSLSQDRVEPILLERARRRGADVRFGTEVLDLDPGEDGVAVRVRDRATGRESVLRAGYVIAADGAHGATRERAGIGRRGRGVLRHQMSVLFDADLAGPLRGRRFAVCQVANDRVEGVLGHDDSLTRGTLIVTYRPERGESPGDFTEERCAGLVRAALGVPDARVGVRQILPWEMAALTAERFRWGRVFLAGDAAHLMPPVGGYGANCGVQDAYDLAWKLEAVTEGTAPPELLDTYDEERRPVAEATVRQAVARLAVRSGRRPAGPDLAEPLAVTFGYRYRSSTVRDGDGPAHGDGGEGADGFVHPALLSGRPGTRAPHLWVRVDGARVSTLDLFGPRPVLLAGSAGAERAGDLRALAERLGVPLDVYVLGRDVLAQDGADPHAAFGIGPQGMSLVRPDGFVSHRSPAGGLADSAVAGALARMLRRVPVDVPTGL